MRRRAIILPILLLCVATAPNLRAEPIKGIPSDRGAQGDAFIEAWLAFRRDLDSLFSLDVHPAQCREWLVAMPGFLLRDAMRMATHHQVLVDMAALLARKGGKQNRTLLRHLADRSDPTVGLVLRMHLIRSRDPAAVSTALKALNHRVVTRRLEGAIALAGGGRREGFDYLKTAVKKDRRSRAQAARALGRYGGDAEERFINGAIGRAPTDTALRVARGELLLRKQFPYHHRRLTARYPIDQAFSEEGIYETWLLAVERALSSGRGGSEAVFDAIKGMRRSPPPGRDPELVKRQMGALYDFWSAIDARIAANLRFSPPASFTEAMQAITRPRERKEEPECFIGARVSAAIAVLTALGDRLSYPQLAEPTPGVNAISPLGERAVDGNLATSWPAKQGSELVLEHSKPAFIKALAIVVSCPDQTEKASLQINIEGMDKKQKAWKRRQTLTHDTRYFQVFNIKRESNHRITISVKKVKGRSLACVAEIRVMIR